MNESARLSQLSSRTLTLVLERQRLHSSGVSPPPSQLSQIVRNLANLRSGIIDLESPSNPLGGGSTKVLRQQWSRMMMMMENEPEDVFREVGSLPPEPHSPPPPKSPLLTAYSGNDPVDTPYMDDPDDPSEEEFRPHEMIGAQQMMMQEQDAHLDVLSQSIGRQRDISLHIGSELEVHDGLLDDLGHRMDGTQSRLSGAKKRLDRVAKGTRDNASTVTIGLLIFILLILIVIFKT